MASEATPRPLPLDRQPMDRVIVRAPRPWWRQPRTLFVGGALLVAMLLWWLIPASGSMDVAVSDLEIGPVTREAFTDDLAVRGTVAPAVTTLVNSVSGGQVDELLAQDGAQVTVGQPLVSLSNPAFKLDILTREAAIVAQLGALSGDDLSLQRNRLDLDSQTAAATYDLLKAKRDLSVKQRLYDQGIVADAAVAGYREQQEYQVKRLAQLRAGQASQDRVAALQTRRLAETRARLTEMLAAVRASLDDFVVRASIKGRLTNFSIQPGQTLKPGDPVGQIDSEGSWKLIADVDEFYLGRVAVGQSATIASDAQLTLAKVLPAVTNGRFRVELAFVGALPPDLRRGQTTDVRITLGATQTATIVPVGGWLDSGGGTSAFVVDPDGRHARRRAIRIAGRNPRQVKIVSGLAPGERIVISGTPNVTADLLNLR